MSDTSIRMSLPTSAGSMCWYSIGSTLTAEACSPALCANAEKPDVRLVGARRDVGDLADRVGDPAHLGQAALRQHHPALLQLQPGDHAEQVGVAGPLPVAVGAALHVADPGLHRDQAVGHRAGGVVVAVDAEPGAGGRGHRADHVAELAGEHAAVGVAQRDHVRARLGGGPDHLQRVGRVRPVPVEEVLRVQEHPLPLGAQVADRVPDHGQVLVQRGPQGQPDMPVVTLGDKSHDRRPGLAQSGDLRVVGRLHAGPAGRAERGELRVPEVQFGAGPPEELGVLGDRAGPATLDEADAELVQPAGDGQLVGDGEAQPFLLGTVAQRGVVDVELVVRH